MSELPPIIAHESCPRDAVFVLQLPVEMIEYVDRVELERREAQLAAFLPIVPERLVVKEPRRNFVITNVGG